MVNIHCDPHNDVCVNGRALHEGDKDLCTLCQFL